MEWPNLNTTDDQLNEISLTIYYEMSYEKMLVEAVAEAVEVVMIVMLANGANLLGSS